MGGTLTAEAVWDYREDIQRLAAKLCRHHQDAEDVAQTSMLKAAAAIEGFRGEASVRTWLHRVTTNECAMKRRRSPDLSYEKMIAEGWVDTDHGDDRPERLALESEERREVLRAIGTLPPDYQCVLLLRDGEGLPAKEVARILGTTVPAVKSSLNRARKRLREVLDRTGTTEERARPLES